MDIIITPGTLRGTLEAPPSKSHAHRLMTAVALAGKKNSESLCTSEDTRATFRCLNELHDGGILDCGESGTTLRFLLPVASALGINAEFIGHGRLPERPMSALNNALRENGAVISADNLPIKVSGQLHPGVFRVPGNISSQFISGLLFALPLLDGDSEIVIEGKRESVGYIDMTLDTLRSFSINIEETPSGYKIKGSQKYIEPDSPRVQGDWSNAAFFLCAGALGGETDITGLSPDSRQSDRAIVNILKDFGADVKCGDMISVRGNGLRGIKIDISQCVHRLQRGKRGFGRYDIYKRRAAQNKRERPHRGGRKDDKITRRFRRKHGGFPDRPRHGHAPGRRGRFVQRSPHRHGGGNRGVHMRKSRYYTRRAGGEQIISELL